MKRLAIAAAIALLSNCITIHAADEDKYKALLRQAKDYTADEEYDKAFAAYELAQRVDAENPEAFVAAADLYIFLERYEEAEALADDLLDADSVSLEGWRLRCLIDLGRDDVEKLTEDLLYAEISGTDLKAYYQEIGDAYAQAGEVEKAALYYEEASKKQGGIRNETLDKAFDKGTITLTETAAGNIRVDPAEYGATIKSLSPTGDSALLWNEEEGAAYAVYEDQVLPVKPSDNRGVEDTYGRRAQMFESGLARWIGSEGVTWSHNGKYAVITNWQMALTRMIFHDPLIIDLETGEGFLPGTWPGKPLKEEGAATATTTCFSPDDKFLYYCQYGNAQEGRYSILRYNMETGENTLCWTGEKEILYPYLHETPEGNLINLVTPVRVDQEFGICAFHPENDGYECEFTGSGLSGEDKVMTRRLFYSSNSGYGLCRLESPVYGMNGYDIFFQCFLPDQEFDGYDRLFAIPFEGNQLIEISNRDMETIPEKDRLFSYYGISLIEQSPDGYYALTLCRNRMNDSNKLFLVSLEDMTYVEVKGIDAASIDIFKIEREPVIEWNGESLMIQTTDGIKTFALE